MVTLKAHILPHHDLQPPGCRGSTGSGDYHERSSWPPVHYSDLNMGFEGQLDENVRFRALKPLLSHHSGDSQTLFG